jgi:pilus assembly protein CpaC
LRVRVNKSVLINTRDRLKRVSVTDPSVADAVVVSPTQVLVHGRSPGEVSLLLWDEQERSRTFDLRVDVDVSAAAEEIHRIVPEGKIEVSASRNAIVLSGAVDTKETAERVGLIASAYSKNIINVLTYGPVGAQEILLEVHFAEINRTALQQLGVNIFSTGAANTPGTISTQQFGPPPPVDLTNSIGAPLRGFTTSLTGLQTLNIFLFRPDLNLGATIRALAQKNVLQVLAEPNLIAFNGREANFLAGGEFPVPVVQSGTTTNNITVLFKEFGVRLSFTPLITPNGEIRLQVKPEVSALDFANGVQLSGFVIPALTTRRASTELQLKNGQSFVIAGLMDNRVRREMSKIPGLGDIPILGKLFQSRNLQKTNTELMVLVTAHLVSPSDQAPPYPKLPETPIDKEKFDPGKKPTAGGR